MTVQSTVRTASYTGNGATTQFPIPFAFQENSHVKVTRTLSGVTSALSEGSDYTIANSNVVLGFALPSGATLLIERVIPLLQPTDLNAFGTFSPDAHEAVFDRLTMLDQQAQDALTTRIAAERATAAAEVALARAELGTAPGTALDARTVQSSGSTSARTLASRHAEQFNVKDYGAAGDGSADDTAAINAALTAAAAASTALVYFPPGIYRVTGTLTVPAGGRLVLWGYGVRLRHNPSVANTDLLVMASRSRVAIAGFNILNTNANTRRLISLSSVNYSQLRDLSFERSGASNPAACIYFTALTDVLFERVHINETGPAFVYGGSGTDLIDTRLVACTLYQSDSLVSTPIPGLTLIACTVVRETGISPGSLFRGTDGSMTTHAGSGGHGITAWSEFTTNAIWARATVDASAIYGEGVSAASAGVEGANLSLGVGGRFGSGTARGALNLIPRAADPTAPQNGDIWILTTGVLKVRLNGVTRTVTVT